MSPKRGIKLDQIVEFPDQTGLIGLPLLATGGTEFFGTTLYANDWSAVQLGSNASNSNGQLAAWPIPIPEPITVDALRINVSTAADAGDDVRMGIYTNDGLNGAPGALHATTTDVVIATTGTKDGTFTAVLLSPGLWWFAICGVNIDGSTNPKFRGAAPNQSGPYYVNHDIADNSFEHHAWGKSIGAVAALPDPFPTDAGWTGGNNSPGRIHVQARVA